MSTDFNTKAQTSLDLMKRWVVNYFNQHSDAAARQFIAPEYQLEIGDVVLRDVTISGCLLFNSNSSCFHH